MKVEGSCSRETDDSGWETCVCKLQDWEEQACPSEQTWVREATGASLWHLSWVFVEEERSKFKEMPVNAEGDFGLLFGLGGACLESVLILWQGFWASLVTQRWSIHLQCRRCGFDPWVGKIPWRRKWQPILVFLPGKFHGQRSLVGYSSWGRKRVGWVRN